MSTNKTYWIVEYYCQYGDSSDFKVTESINEAIILAEEWMKHLTKVPRYQEAFESGQLHWRPSGHGGTWVLLNKEGDQYDGAGMRIIAATNYLVRRK